MITLALGKNRSRGNIVTQDMVRTLAQEAVGDGVLHKDEAQYIDKIFEFGNRTVEEVMTPRSNIFFLRSDMALEEILKEVRRTRHTKIPIYGTDRDEVLGILYARDLLAADLSQFKDDPKWLLPQLREPFLVPQTKPIVELFRTFRKRRLSLALAVDEYGGVTGLITVEDLLECIFGDLPSASEMKVAGELSKRVKDADSLQASMTVDQFNTGLDANLPTDIANTIGGLILHEYGEMPQVNATVAIQGWELTVISVKKNRIQEIRAEKLEKGRTRLPGAVAHAANGGPKPSRKGEKSEITTPPDLPASGQAEGDPRGAGKQKGEE